MLEIARSELIQIFRNRLVMVTGLVIPVVVSAFFVYRHELFADGTSLGYIAAIVVFTVMSFGLYTTAVTTLASRRQNLFLKRLRSTAAGDADILIGLVLPVIRMLGEAGERSRKTFWSCSASTSGRARY